MIREFRVLRASELRVRDDKGGITGYAAVFGSLSEDLGGFREMLMPSTFKRCLGTAPDVKCLFNHDANLVLGRTKSGTLRLEEDNTGLHFNCDTPDTQQARDLLVSIQRGDIDQCSFAMVVQRQNWREEKTSKGDLRVIREVSDADVFDVSPVTYPAYTQTSCSARSLWPDGMPQAVAEHTGVRLARKREMVVLWASHLKA